MCCAMQGRESLIMMGEGTLGRYNRTGDIMEQVHLGLELYS